jgi:hypothetical protein
MATRLKTIQYYFPHLANAADAIDTSFTPIVVYIPETIKEFKSVFITITANDLQTTAANITVRNVDIQLGSAGYQSSDNTQTLTTSGEQFSLVYTQDFTSYFTTNWSDASMSMNCRINIDASSQGTANLTSLATITYTYDDTSPIHIKTVWIPLNASTGALPASKPAGAIATIPALNSYLPEASINIRQTALCIQGNTEYVGTTDMTLSYEIDSTGAFTSALFEQGLASAISHRLGNVVNFTTDVSHNFFMWASLASFSHQQTWLNVTYEFDPSLSNIILNSLLIPMDWAGTAGTSSTTYQRAIHELWIQESNITVQTCALFIFYEAANAISGLNARIGTESFITYGSVGTVNCGSMALMIRNDSISLDRGRNFLQADIYKTDTTDPVAGLSSFWMINYHSDKNTSGVGVHNHTVLWNLISTSTLGATASKTSSAIAIDIPETNYFFNPIGIENIYQSNSTINPGGIFIGVEKLVVESGFEWLSMYECMNSSDPETGIRWAYARVKNALKQYPQDFNPIHLDIETSRRYIVTQSSNGWSNLTFYLNYHSITYIISGNITNSNGGTVHLYLQKSTLENVNNKGEIMQTTDIVGDGAYSFTVYDNTEQYQVAAYESATFKGISKIDDVGTDFDISLHSPTDYAFIG